MMRAIGVIPARFASTRFPAKMLADLCGKPLVVRVMERAMQARKLEKILVATDDMRIADAVKAHGGTPVMTRPDHPSGTDRILEAVEGLDVDVVVNIQGDEPLIDPGLVDALAVALLDDSRWDMATACTPIVDHAQLVRTDVVKVVFNAEGRALYFSRLPIPFCRDNDVPLGGLYWRHLGLYAYRKTFLQKVAAAPVCLLEKAEKLEQLRALHLGCNMKVLITEDFGTGVDTPEDLERARKMMVNLGS